MNLCNNVFRFSRFTLYVRNISIQNLKQTYVFRMVHQPERTPEGKHQRRPHEKLEFQKLELLEIEDEKPIGPLRVILLEDIEGLGLQFDVIEADRMLARNNLIPLKKAAYASPFNLDYYAKKKESMREELERRVRIPYEFLKLGRTLLKKVVPLLVSMENSWTVDRTLVTLSLLQAGIETSPEFVFMSRSELSGPNLDLEAKLIRFYIAINKQYIIPMIGRLTHISSDDTKKNLYPDELNVLSDGQLQKSGLRQETPYFFRKPFDDNFDVFDFMKNRTE